jgi:cysteine-rich repeat protein
VQDSSEECEDGNLLSHDGCDSQCKLEAVTWTEVPIGPFLLGGAVYDPARSVLVAPANSDVWEHDGERWVWREAAGQLNSRIEAGRLAYFHPGRGVVGVHHEETQDPNKYVLSLRAWDGTAWTSFSEGSAPTGYASGAGYDPVGDRTIVTSGSTGNLTYTWSVGSDGVWTALSTLPSYYSGSDSAYDAGTGRVVLLVDNTQIVRTYVLDGGTWTPGTAPPLSSPVSVLGLDGHIFVMETETGITVEYVGGGWQRRPELDYTADRSSDQAVFYFDQERDAFAYWTASRLSHLIDGRWEHTVFPGGYANYIPVGDAFLAVSAGTISSAQPMEAWRIGRDGVFRATSPNAPEGRVGMECLVVPGRRGTVCRGGYRYPTPNISVGFDETFVVDETGWRALALSPPLPPGLMAYDPDGRQLIVAGRSAVAILPDTADGWTSFESDFGGPEMSSVAWDARAHRLVATWFDYGQSSDVGGIMELVDGAWRMVQLAPFSPLIGIANERRGTTHLFDADTRSFEQHPDWERTGTEWTVDPVPPPGGLGSLISNPRTGEILMVHLAHGGYWAAIRHYVSPTPFETCGPLDDADVDLLVGCDDPDCYVSCGTCPPFATCAP